MSISDWFKRVFSSPARTDAAVGSDEEIDIHEARLEAGGGGVVGVTGDPSSHASPAEEIAEAEAEAD